MTTAAAASQVTMETDQQMLKRTAAGGRESIQDWLKTISPTHDREEKAVDEAGSQSVPRPPKSPVSAAAAPAKPAATDDDLSLGAEARTMKLTEGAIDVNGSSDRKVAGVLRLKFAKTPMQSFNSDWSKNSYDSVEQMLQERLGDPEEILANLGFAGMNTDEVNFHRIPQRFIFSSSSANGINIPQVLESNPTWREFMPEEEATEQVTGQCPQGMSPFNSLQELVEFLLRADVPDRFISASDERLRKLLLCGVGSSMITVATNGDTGDKNEVCNEALMKLPQGGTGNAMVTVTNGDQQNTQRLGDAVVMDAEVLNCPSDANEQPPQSSGEGQGCRGSTGKHLKGDDLDLCHSPRDLHSSLYKQAVEALAPRSLAFDDTEFYIMDGESDMALEQDLPNKPLQKDVGISWKRTRDAVLPTETSSQDASSGKHPAPKPLLPWERVAIMEVESSYCEEPLDFCFYGDEDDHFSGESSDSAENFLYYTTSRQRETLV